MHKKIKRMIKIKYDRGKHTCAFLSLINMSRHVFPRYAAPEPMPKNKVFPLNPSYNLITTLRQ